VGSVLEEENKILKEQVQRLTELMNNDPSRLNSRSRANTHPKDDGPVRRFSTATEIGGAKVQSITECRNSITQTLLEMREAQILKLKSEIEDRAREFQDLKQRLSRQAQQSTRELSEATSKLAQTESQLMDRDQQIKSLTEQHELTKKDLEELTHKYNHTFKNQMAHFMRWTRGRSNVLVNAKALSLLIVSVLVFYGYSSLV
jgi:hypothetical protein